MGFYWSSTSLNAGICTYCIVSSNPELNSGNCRGGTTGDVCHDSGSGTACEKNGSEECGPIE